MTEANAGLCGVLGVIGLNSQGNSLAQRRIRLVLGVMAPKRCTGALLRKRGCPSVIVGKALNGALNPEPQTYNPL